MSSRANTWKHHGTVIHSRQAPVAVRSHSLVPQRSDGVDFTEIGKSPAGHREDSKGRGGAGAREMGYEVYSFGSTRGVDTCRLRSCCRSQSAKLRCSERASEKPNAPTKFQKTRLDVSIIKSVLLDAVVFPLMFSPRLLQVSRQLRPYVCAFCSASRSLRPRTRFLSATVPCLKSKKNADRTTNGHEKSSSTVADAAKKQDVQEATQLKATKSRRKRRRTQQVPKSLSREQVLTYPEHQGHPKTYRIRKIKSQSADKSKEPSTTVREKDQPEEYKSLKEALLEKKPKKSKKRRTPTENLLIEVLSPDDLTFEPIEHAIPPVPRLSHGLDRVLFNPGVYRLQDPRSRVYNFDPYLEKIMPAAEFDFDSLSEYKTSSKDEDLLAMTRKLGTKFTGSTSSMSGVLQHFHFLLSNFRELNHSMLSRKYPESSTKFSKITRGPSAIFLRWKHGLYAIDADKSFDEPNIMSWLGHSMEKLLTNSRTEFERYRRSTPESAPNEDESGKCFHYSRSGNFLVRSQLDAQDSRLPGTGIFDLKTRAVVSIRMDHTEYETGSGYQIRFDQGEWESYEREFYDMTRATMLKYSLQVRMGRMDGIFVAYHNIERMFGFQYLSLPDMDNVLHGQTDTCLGDQEFRLSLRLLDELLQRATQKFPETVSIYFKPIICIRR